MNSLNASDVIRQNNLAYLLHARALLRTDRVQAIKQLRISSEIADTLVYLTAHELLEIAYSNLLMCRFLPHDHDTTGLTNKHFPNTNTAL